MLRRHAIAVATFFGIVIAFGGCNVVFHEGVEFDAAPGVDGSDAPAPLPANIVFITANIYNGALGGISGANAKCQLEAMTNGVEGEFVALIADNNQNYIGGLGTASRGWTTRSGTIVADMPTDFLNGEILHPITELADGKPLSSTTALWTGSYATGEIGPNCTGWSSTGATGLVGDAELDKAGVGAAAGCDVERHLLCAGKGRVVEIRPPTLAVADKRIFISRKPFTSNSGRAEADRICREEAIAAALPQGEGYLAILGVSSTSALVRFSNEIYYRTDGVAIGPLASAPLSFLDREATGKRTAGGGVVASGWSATDPTLFCSDWGDNSANQLVLAYGDFAGERARNYGTDRCSSPHLVYCALP